MRTKKNAETTYELRYTGWLAENCNAPIYLHYGTQNWTEVSEEKMRKLKNCYKAEVTVPSTTSISFCFRDTEGNWDNNAGNDYWYTPSIGETYSCVEINEASASAPKAVKSTKSAKAPATKKTTTRKSKSE